jgi:hypothetical protein
VALPNTDDFISEIPMTTLIADFAAFPVRFSRHPSIAPSECPSNAPHELAADGVLRVRWPLGQTVRCLTGSVWLTLDGDNRDIVLSAGAEHRCDRNSMLLIQAIGGDARLRIG